MMTPEDKRWIVMEIRRQVQIITGGTAGENTKTSQTIENLMPGHPPIPARPIVFPYGFVSRAPRGTLAITAQQGEHPGNKLTLGHRDPEAPDVDVGESGHYSSGGFKIMARNGQVEILSPDGDQIVVSNGVVTITNELGATIALNTDGKISFASELTDLKTVLKDLIKAFTATSNFIQVIAGLTPDATPVVNSVIQPPALATQTALAAVVLEIGQLLE